ncbi:MAG: hypothetical protein U5R49_06430 [Deltaproteobacteria bacterium]|nr:hypothetical protein [Deltaproteobacteria bacterium]
MDKEQELIVVFGAGGHVKVVLATIESEGKYEIVGLLDDDKGKQGTQVCGYRVLGGKDETVSMKEQGVS